MGQVGSTAGKTVAAKSGRLIYEYDLDGQLLVDQMEVQVSAV